MEKNKGNSYLEAYIEDNIKTCIENGGSVTQGTDSSQSGQLGQELRNTLRDKILLPLVWAGLIKDDATKSAEQ